MDEIAEQIALLEDSGRAGALITSLNQSRDSVKQSYYRMLESLAAGSYINAGTESQTLLSHISTYSMLVKPNETAIMIASLENRRQALLNDWAGTQVAYVATHGTNFVQKCDGYESVFAYTSVAEMTAADFYAMTEAEPASTAGAVGKMINSHTWYAAIPVTEENAERFAPGDTYTFTFVDNDGIALPLTLERVLEGTDGQQPVLIFSCTRTPEGFDFLRTQRVQCVVDEITGYRVPIEALREHNGEKGVFILADSSVEFRRINIVREGAGYYIVQTYAQDAQGGAGIAKYLQYGDLIITAGRDLYIGKMYG